ncbi:MAG: hypothetical protein Tp1111SUR522732_7 [Prokaryotic dsDNA virus sp.]|uniref:hypothetical protein n=1 Tax=Methylophaga sp. UBA2689 TaxID=1946878 RepID=UPI00118CF188|nr:hypothetical protein [Methylophaga sp. UBA2689]QDP47069.1 MAG: hypothetical protein Tp1111SUR522732_7 [Prokaryotic dsDNA virus sp.]|tara:strand:- start:2404 stop:3450 length:1047 start_codon:yes stop_codon:yes gene_type:complete
MSQSDYEVEDQTGASFLGDINSILAAIVTNNSGPTEPGTTFAHQWWSDTTSNILKRRNAANTSWVNVIGLSQSLTNVSNTSDANKPVSTATQAALDALTTSIPGLVDSNAPAQISGLVVTNNATDLEHDIDISSGQFGSVKLSSGLTKRLDASFASGDGNGGMVGALPSSGVVYVFLIKNGSSIDVYAETTNGENPPSGWTIVKRIAVRITDASNNLQRVIVSGSGQSLIVYPHTVQLDWSVSTVPTSRTAYPISSVLSCPPNVNAGIIHKIASGAPTNIYMNSLLEESIIPVVNGFGDFSTGSNGAQGSMQKLIRVNGDRQVGVVRSGTDPNVSYIGFVSYWIEDRS